MRMLLVEDQADKREEIKKFIRHKFPHNLKITDKESLRGALKEIITCNSYDIILLDMSMPNFDPSVESSADISPESFAGKEFLEQMNLRDIKIPVIVITQYSSFEGGTVSLDSLSNEFTNKYKDFYLGSVYYNPAMDTWEKELGNLLRFIA